MVIFCRPPSVKNPTFPFPTVKKQKLAKAIWEFWDWLDFRIAALCFRASFWLCAALCGDYYAQCIMRRLYRIQSRPSCSCSIHTNNAQPSPLQFIQIRCAAHSNTFYSYRRNIIWYLIIHCIMHNYAEFNIDHCAQSRLLHSHQ